MKPGRTYNLNRDTSATPSRKPRARAATGAKNGLWSNKQKARICQLANAAAEAHGITGWREKIAWRHEQQLAALGLKSLTAATQAQYADLKAHFEALAGDPARAYETVRHGQDNDRRVARWQLDNAIRKSGLHMAYANAICKSQYRCGLEDATTEQLWQLFYTVRNRSNAKRKKEGNAPF